MKENKPLTGKSKAYIKPALTRFGKLSKLTHTGSGNATEGVGGGDPATKMPMT